MHVWAGNGVNLHPSSSSSFRIHWSQSVYRTNLLIAYLAIPAPKLAQSLTCWLKFVATLWFSGYPSQHWLPRLHSLVADVGVLVPANKGCRSYRWIVKQCHVNQEIWIGKIDIFSSLLIDNYKYFLISSSNIVSSLLISIWLIYRRGFEIYLYELDIMWIHP